MSATTGPRASSELRIKYLQLPVAAAVKCNQGARACIDTSVGYVLPAKTSTTLIGVGEFAETKDNTGGAGGALLVNVNLDHEVVCRWYASDTGGGLVTAAMLGQDVYWKDDQTVTATSTGASKAGRVWALDPVKGVAVEMYTL